MVNIKDRPRSGFLLSFFLIVVIAVVFWQVSAHDFVTLDDGVYVYENHQLRKGFTIENIMWAFKLKGAAYWHPLTWLSHLLDVQLFGLNPGMHHMTNLFFHLANTLLLFAVLHRMTGAVWQSFFVAALFGLHPLNVESVAWVAARKNLLSTFFWMLTLFTYARYAEHPNSVRYIFVLAVFSLGLMAKPMLVTLPFVLLLLDYWPLGRIQLLRSNTGIDTGSRLALTPGFQGPRIFRLVLEKIPLLAFSAVSIILSLSSYKQVISYKMIPMNLRLSNVLVSYVSYIAKMVWPQKLAVFYPYPAILPWPQVTGAGLLLIFISVLIIREMGTRPYLVVGWLWYLGTLVPVIGLMQWGLWPAMADRFVYVPLVGLFIIIAWGGSDLLIKIKHNKIFLGISTVIIIFTLSICTYYQLRHWKNSSALYQNAINVTDNNYFAYNGLGAFLHKEGDIDGAIRNYRKALSIKPDYDDAHSNLGLALFDKRKINEAVFEYNKALKIRPDNVAALYNMGNAFADVGEFDEAVFYYKEALKIKPEYTEALFNLANTQVHRGSFDEAAVNYTKVFKIDPEYVKAHHNYGNLLFRQGKYKEAMFHCTEAIKIDPQLAEPYDLIGVILARQGKYKKARVFFLKALQIRPNDTTIRKHLEKIELNAIGQ